MAAMQADELVEVVDTMRVRRYDTLMDDITNVLPFCGYALIRAEEWVYYHDELLAAGYQLTMGPRDDTKTVLPLMIFKTQEATAAQK